MLYLLLRSFLVLCSHIEGKRENQNFQLKNRPICIQLSNYLLILYSLKPNLLILHLRFPPNPQSRRLPIGPDPELRRVYRGVQSREITGALNANQEVISTNVLEGEVFRESDFVAISLELLGMVGVGVAVVAEVDGDGSVARMEVFAYVFG
jgi:hypothetical protein